MNEFWLVWDEHGNRPTVKHDSATSAQREAERLARANMGHTFHVLKVVGSCSKTDVSWTRYEGAAYDDLTIPF